MRNGVLHYFDAEANANSLNSKKFQIDPPKYLYCWLTSGKSCCCSPRCWLTSRRTGRPSWPSSPRSRGSTPSSSLKSRSSNYVYSNKCIRQFKPRVLFGKKKLFQLTDVKNAIQCFRNEISEQTNCCK